MRVIELGERGADIYALIGDGGRELRIFRIAAEKYNHSKIVKIPKLRPSQRTTGVRGLDAVIRELALLLPETAVTTYIILIDREHVSNIEQLRRKLEEYGFAVPNYEVLHDGCWKVRVEKGTKGAIVYVAVFGFEKIEEHLAELIRLLYNEQVEPKKDAVNRWLKQHKLKDEDLVKEALRRQVFEKTFPQLAIALRELAKSS